MIGGYEGCYTLALTNKDEDGKRLNEDQRDFLNRDYSTRDEASRTKSVKQEEWGIALTIKPTIKSTRRWIF